MNHKKILILGATGMLGHTLFYELSKNKNFNVWATVRKKEGLENFFKPELMKKIVEKVDADYFESVKSVIKELRPDILINCIGIIKQLPSAEDPITTISINALFPHQVAQVCKETNTRMIHISTDCVFDGKKGSYTEDSPSDAYDLYGKTKYLGEVKYPHTLTLRTSIIGHELKTSFSLVDWFLTQNNKVRGFKKAIYTGFPTVEIAEIIEKYVIPHPELNGLYQMSSEPISKYDLLHIISKIYHKSIQIEAEENTQIDRSLLSERFRKAFGYKPPSWEKLVEKMYKNYQEIGIYNKF